MENLTDISGYVKMRKCESCLGSKYTSEYTKKLEKCSFLCYTVYKIWWFMLLNVYNVVRKRSKPITGILKETHKYSIPKEQSLRQIFKE